MWCDWSPCWDGCCISWTGTEKSYALLPWLRYLIDHFFKPGGKASADSRFDSFTFDHRLNGTVVGCRRDNKELSMVQVDDNQITESVLRSADARYVDVVPLPYEDQIDRDRAVYRRRRRPVQGEQSKVVGLAPANV